MRLTLLFTFISLFTFGQVLEEGKFSKNNENSKWQFERDFVQGENIITFSLYFYERHKYEKYDRSIGFMSRDSVKLELTLFQLEYLCSDTIKEDIEYTPTHHSTIRFGYNSELKLVYITNGGYWSYFKKKDCLSFIELMRSKYHYFIIED